MGETYTQKPFFSTGTERTNGQFSEEIEIWPLENGCLHISSKGSSSIIQPLKGGFSQCVPIYFFGEDKTTSLVNHFPCTNRIAAMIALFTQHISTIHLSLSPNNCVMFILFTSAQSGVAAVSCVVLTPQHLPLSRLSRVNISFIEFSHYLRRSRVLGEQLPCSHPATLLIT